MNTANILKVLVFTTSIFVFLGIGYVVSGEWLGPDPTPMFYVAASMILALSLYGFWRTKVRTYVFMKYIIVFMIPFIFLVVDSLGLSPEVAPFSALGVLILVLLVSLSLHKRRTGNFWGIPESMKGEE